MKKIALAFVTLISASIGYGQEELDNFVSTGSSFQSTAESTEDFSIDYETIVTGINSLTTITHAGDERIFATQQPGRIRIFYRAGTLESMPFMDIQSRVEDGASEQGLLGLAFEPNFCETGRFYVNYTHRAQVNEDSTKLRTRISRFTVLADNPAMGDPDSEEVLIEFDQDFSNHNGGHIEFGLDGYLYIGTGDGGSGGDPNNRAQDITSYLGKMLRIDVSPETGYDIPLDNPYIFDDFGQDEIWSYGLRNPWKFAFDREMGNLYIADVGQSAFEEVNFEPAEASGGLNYGWRCYEGESSYNLTGCEASDYIYPILDYPHSGGNCSVTGGRVYRGPSFEAFEGWYFYSDYCSGRYWAVMQDGNTTLEQDFGNIGQNLVSTFGEDVWGEIYFANGNKIHRLLDPNDVLVEPIVQTGNLLSSTLIGASYQWFLNGELVGTTAQIELTEAGEYTLIVTTGVSTCQVTSVFVASSLSTRNLSAVKNLLNVFPNPAQESVAVNIEEYSAEAHSLAVYAIDGRLIQSLRVNSTVVNLDLSEFKVGSYILLLLDTNGTSIAQAKLIRN